MCTAWFWRQFASPPGFKDDIVTLTTDSKSDVIALFSGFEDGVVTLLCDFRKMSSFSLLAWRTIRPYGFKDNFVILPSGFEKDFVILSAESCNSSIPMHKWFIRPMPGFRLQPMSADVQVLSQPKPMSLPMPEFMPMHRPKTNRARSSAMPKPTGSGAQVWSVWHFRSSIFGGGFPYIFLPWSECLAVHKGLLLGLQHQTVPVLSLSLS